MNFLTSPRYHGVVTNKPDLNFWLVTDFVTGHSLAKLVNQPELKSLYKIRRKDRLKMSACLASAMDYLHTKDLVHGDITPSNVLVCRHGDTKEIKITDFGLLEYKSIVEDPCYIPASGKTSSTCFQPPEVLAEGEAWSMKADVWSLGALLLEWNLESYMWDSHCIDKAKTSYVSNAGKKQEPIRFGLKIRSSSFEFLWDCLSYTIKKRPSAKSITDGLEMLVLQVSDKRK